MTPAHRPLGSALAGVVAAGALLTAGCAPSADPLDPIERLGRKAAHLPAVPAAPVAPAEPAAPVAPAPAPAPVSRAVAVVHRVHPEHARTHARTPVRTQVWDDSGTNPSSLPFPCRRDAPRPSVLALRLTEC